MESKDKEQDSYSYLIDSHTSTQYISDSFNAKIRRELLDLNSSGRDYYKECFDSLELEGYESILNIGSGDGLEESKWIIDYGHQGPVTALEVPKAVTQDDGRFYGAEERLRAAGKTNFSVVKGVAEDLPFPDSSFEVITMEHVIYHVDPTKAISEIKRVLVDGGKFMVTSNGKHNKPRHHYFLKRIGRMTESKSPGAFSSYFNMQKLLRIMPLHFDMFNKVVQLDEIVIDTDQKKDKYTGSIDTYRPSFKPVVDGQTWLRAREKVVDAKILEEIEAFGSFRDRIERGGGTFINKKRATFLGNLATRFATI